MKKIELIVPHEHAGRIYPEGSQLTLQTDDADWLIALKKARAADIKPQFTPSSGKGAAITSTKESAT